MRYHLLECGLSMIDLLVIVYCPASSISAILCMGTSTTQYIKTT